MYIESSCIRSMVASYSGHLCLMLDFQFLRLLRLGNLLPANRETNRKVDMALNG